MALKNQNSIDCEGEMVEAVQRRQDQRYNLRCAVTLHIYDDDADDREEFVIHGHTTSISRGGIFFSSRSLLLNESARVELELDLPDKDEPLKASGSVARYFKLPATSVDEYEPGMGIQFVDLSPENAQRIGSVVDRLSQSI